MKVSGEIAMDLEIVASVEFNRWFGETNYGLLFQILLRSTSDI